MHTFIHAGMAPDLTKFKGCKSCNTLSDSKLSSGYTCIIMCMGQSNFFYYLSYVLGHLKIIKLSVVPIKAQT